MVELVQLSATPRHYLTHLLRRLCETSFES